MKDKEIEADMTNCFGRRAQLESGLRTGTVLQADHDGSVLIRWDSDNTSAGLSWHKVSGSVDEVILVQPEATPTMHRVAQASLRAALPPLIGGVPA